MDDNILDEKWTKFAYSCKKAIDHKYQHLSWTEWKQQFFAQITYLFRKCKKETTFLKHKNCDWHQINFSFCTLLMNLNEEIYPRTKICSWLICMNFAWHRLWLWYLARCFRLTWLSTKKVKDFIILIFFVF